MPYFITLNFRGTKYLRTKDAYKSNFKQKTKYPINSINMRIINIFEMRYDVVV